MEHRSGNHILVEVYKNRSHCVGYLNCKCVSRTLPATVGRRDGEEVMVAASAGEVQGEGEILPNLSFI